MVVPAMPRSGPKYGREAEVGSDSHTDVSGPNGGEEIGVGSSVPEIQILPRKPQQPRMPFELFPSDLVERQTRRHSADGFDLASTRVKKGWEDDYVDLDHTWPAQDRRQMQGHTDIPEHEEYNQHDFDRLLDRSSLDTLEDDITTRFGDFVHDCLRTMKDHGLLGHLKKPPLRGGLHSGPDTPVESIEPTEPAETHITFGQSQYRRPSPSKPRILYRAELYSVIPHWVHGRAPNSQAVLERSLVRDSPLDTKHQKDSSYMADNDDQPAFEMTTFYAMPPGFKTRKTPNRAPRLHNSFLGEGSGIPDEALAQHRAVDIRAEAGCVLTINSSSIIEAIESCSSKTDQLIYEGESLIIPEPFCVLLQYRDKILQYRDELLGMERSSQLLPDTSDSIGLVATTQERHFKPEHPAESNSHTQHITELYEVLDAQYLDQLRNAQHLASKEVPMCTFEWSWLLFKRDSLVYVQEKDTLRAYTVKAVQLKGLFNYDSKTRKPTVKPRWLLSKQRLKFRHRLQKVILKLAYLEFDGEQLVEKEKHLTITPFDGEKPVQELPAFPIEHLNDPNGTIAARILERGKRYISLTKTSYCQYSGQTISTPRRYIHGRIIVDTATYTQKKSTRAHYYEDDYPGYPIDDFKSTMSPADLSSDEDAVNSVDEFEPADYSRRNRKKKHQRRGIDPTNTENKENITREMYMTCSSEVNAYILKERNWALVDVDNISDCEFNEKLIDDLVIGNEAKRLIQALSTTYGLSTEPEAGKNINLHAKRWTADIVPNKGEGQILLLHGKPGVGKTLTAECVAELTKRPLLAITCGDIDNYESERRLNEWLRLGMLWNAILLFDEADVYLESRQRGNLSQNSMVSVFLRALENYQGLLFLTTNRIGTFDEAILSRVHVVLHYPDLTDRERERIWETAFRRLDEERPDIKLGVTLLDYAYHSPEIRTLAWNGREIRNAFNTMIALAVWDAHHHARYTRDNRIEVRREHLQQVAAMSGSFKNYLLSLRGVDESLHAKMMNLRDDQFNEESK